MDSHTAATMGPGPTLDGKGLGSRHWGVSFYADEIHEDYEDNYETETNDYLDEQNEEEYYMDAQEEHIGYFVDDGINLEDPEISEYAADVLQAEQEYYFARKGAAAKGSGIPARRFEVSGSLSIKERRAKSAALKAKTTCRRCGATGHWSGDSACPHSKSKGGGKKGGGKYRYSNASPSSTSTSSSPTTKTP